MKASAWFKNVLKGVDSGQIEKFYLNEALFKELLRKRIRSLSMADKKQITITLGGTRAYEVKTVLQWLDDCLKDVARGFKISDVDDWISSWQIKIRAINMETSALFHVDEKLKEEHVSHKDWVQLEYMNLLDERQWPRLLNDPADIFLVMNSLYLGGWSYDTWDISPDRLSRLAFISHVTNFVKPKGIFVTERPYDAHRVSPPKIRGFDEIEENGRTGIYVKSDASMKSGQAGKAATAAQPADRAMNTKDSQAAKKVFELVGNALSQGNISIMINKTDLKKITPGGIDLNPAQMSMRVKKEGEDFKFDFNGTEIDAAQVIGATFTIRTMKPVTNLPQILGLNLEPAESQPELLAKA